MLIGCLPDSPQVKCQIAKFVDRIWLEDTGDARLLRRLIVAVDRESPASLEAFDMVLPVPIVSSLEDRTADGLDKDHYFNKVSRGGEYRLKEAPNQGDRYPHGIIDIDGIEDVKVYGDMTTRGGALKAYPHGSASLIHIGFPDPVKPGNKILIIIRFDVAGVSQPISSGKGVVPVHWLSLNYFNADSDLFGQVLTAIRGRSCVPFAKFWKELRDDDGVVTHAGGFDIFLYLPANYTAQSETFSRRFSTKLDDRNIDGSASSVRRNKLIWRLKHLLPDPPDAVIPSQRDPQNITGAIASYPETPSSYFRDLEKQLTTLSEAFLSSLKDTTSRLTRLSDSVASVTKDLETSRDSIIRINVALKTSNILAIVALAVAIVGIVVTTCFYFLK